MSEHADLIARLQECAVCKSGEAWARMDGGIDLCIGATLATEAADALAALEAENRRLREALKVFATSADGRRRKDTMGSVCFEQVHLLKARAALRSTEASHD